jgi:hypothetical protein
VQGLLADEQASDGQIIHAFHIVILSIDHFLSWLPMILIAFGNAALRETVLMRYYSEFRSHQLSTFTLIFLVSVYVWFIFPFLKIDSGTDALRTGLIWVILTILFEFTLGRILKRSWTSILQQYDILSGRIWLLFILYLLFLPYWVYLVTT